MEYDYDCLLVGYRDGVINTSSKTVVRIKEGKDFNAAIGYLGTFLYRRGLSFDYINYIEDEYALLAYKLRMRKYRIIGVSSTFITSVDEAKTIIKHIRDIVPNARIIVGGTFIARLINNNNKKILPYLFRQMGADFYINSFQGEMTLVNTVKALKESTDLYQIKNLYFRNGKAYEYTETEAEDNDLEQNTVDWSLFQNKIYETIPVRTAISCPFECAFCTHKADAGKYCYISVEAIEKELDSIAKDENVKMVHFVDDTFNIPKERFREILKMMIKNQYKFQWYSFLRCQFVDEEIVALMKKSRCSFVLLGIESGSQKMLDIMNKRATVAQLKQGVDLLYKYGIKMHGMFLLGFPGETHDTVQETIHFINNLNVTTVSMKVWFYEVSTPITNRKEEFGLEGNHYAWRHNTMDYQTARKYVDQIEERYVDRKYDDVFVSDAVFEKKIEECL